MRLGVLLVPAVLAASAACATGAPSPAADADPAPPAGIVAESPGTRRLTIPSNGARLYAAAWLAEGEGARPTVLFLPGFGGPDRGDSSALVVGELPDGTMLAEVRRAGWNVVSLHYRGYAGSDGAYSYANALADVHASLAWLRSDAVARALGVDASRIAVVGWSMGAARRCT